MARVIFVCDGCGAQKDGDFGALCEAHKPSNWFARRDEDGVQVACSRTCIDAIAAKSGKTSVVLPI